MTNKWMIRAALSPLAFAMSFALTAALLPALAHADHGDCGQPQSRGKKPASSDALVVLRDAVGAGSCGDEQDDCDCDVDASGTVTPRDSLAVLRVAVGFPANLSCGDGCDGPGTTLPGQTTTTEVDDDNGDDSTSTTIQGGGDDDDDGDNSTSTTLQGGGDDNDDQGDDNQGDDDDGGDGATSTTLQGDLN
jgi:hypothetical protein